MLKIGCVVMAAGNGSRFGENKLAKELHGRSLIRRTLDAVPKKLLARVAVVTQYRAIEALAEAEGFTVVRNDRPDLGAGLTVRLGTEALRDCDGILYLVSDQPYLERTSVERVIRRWMEQPDRIVGAAHKGRRGNPCIFPSDLFPELTALEGDRGGSAVIRRHPDRLELVEIPELQLADVDTAEEFQKLRGRAPGE